MKHGLFEMMAIAEVLTGKDDLPEVLFPPSGCTSSLPLLRVTDGVTTALRSASRDDVAKHVVRLKKHEAFADWKADDISAVLEDLRALLASSKVDDVLYVLPT